jgi:hypothetical protein
MMGFAKTLLAAALLAGTAAAQQLEVPPEAIEALGSTRGTPSLKGFVFIDGRYIQPPYTVSRIGNGIFINRILVEMPVPWSRFAPPPPKADKNDADGDFEDVTPAKPAEPPAQPAVKPVPPPAEKPAADERPDEAEKPAKPAADKDDIDSLFDAPAPKKPPKPAKPGDAIDALFDDAPAGSDVDAPAADEPAPVAAPTEPAAPAAEKAEPLPERTKEEIAKEEQLLKDYLDKMRQTYETALNRDEVFFFGRSHARINGNYGTARAMMQVLPDALKTSGSPDELLARLQRGGVYFIDARVAYLLFRNKATYPMLQERLARIKESEILEAAKRKADQQKAREMLY